jgi:N-acetyl-gamma-glutamyl-phosphate reductase
MKIGVIGASGYAGGELLRLLDLHPIFSPEVITAYSNAGEQITSIHPQLTSYQGGSFSIFNPKDFLDCELIFLALPHGESASVISQLPQSAKIVDLGADYRLKDSSAWEKYYGGTHAGSWTYGLADCQPFIDEIKKSSRVANPGCYATAITLACAPSVAVADLADVVVVAASGTTGAGRSAKINLINSEVSGSLTSYKFGGVHQHTPEIEQAISDISGKKSGISFTPILAPMPRGILATISAKMTSAQSSDSVREIYRDFYKSSTFVSVLDSGTMPKTSSVTGTNNAHIQVAVDDHAQRLTVSIAIDNLGKGAAAQAIHNANLMCGLDVTLGLKLNGIGA